MKYRPNSIHNLVVATLVSGFFLFLLPGVLCAEENALLQDAIKKELGAAKMEKKTQKKIDTLATQTQDLFEQYHTLLERTENLKTYNNQLLELTRRQTRSLDTIDEQMNNIEKVRQNIVPFLLRMLDILEQFIRLDTPFLLQERTQRIATLKELMDRPSISLPEKYRRIMEAYQIELEYGRTIETYKETIRIGDAVQTVNILRIGRLLLLYQTLDKKTSGSWSKTDERWQQLPDEYRRSIADGIKIAAKQTPPELFKLPVPAPQVIP